MHDARCEPDALDAIGAAEDHVWFIRPIVLALSLALWVMIGTATALWSTTL